MTSQWKKPRTTKLYLQRPLSERLCLLCPDFKVLNMSLRESPHVGQEAVGFILLHGENTAAFDLDETVFDKITPGIPVYKANNKNEYDISLEAFSGEDRNPAVYFKITVTNNTSNHVTDNLYIMPRSGKDTYMLNQHQEGYSPYRPNHKNWFMLKRTWTKTDTLTAVSDMGCIRLDYDGNIISLIPNGLQHCVEMNTRQLLVGGNRRIHLLRKRSNRRQISCRILRTSRKHCDDKRT